MPKIEKDELEKLIDGFIKRCEDEDREAESTNEKLENVNIPFSWNADPANPSEETIREILITEGRDDLIELAEYYNESLPVEDKSPVPLSEWFYITDGLNNDYRSLGNKYRDDSERAQLQPGQSYYLRSM